MNNNKTEILNLIKKREAKHIVSFAMKKYNNQNTWFDIIYENMNQNTDINISEFVIKLNRTFWDEVKKGNIEKPVLEGDEYL